MARPGDRLCPGGGGARTIRHPIIPSRSFGSPGQCSVAPERATSDDRSNPRAELPTIRSSLLLSTSYKAVTITTARPPGGIDQLL